MPSDLRDTVLDLISDSLPQQEYAESYGAWRSRAIEHLNQMNNDDLLSVISRALEVRERDA